MLSATSPALLDLDSDTLAISLSLADLVSYPPYSTTRQSSELILTGLAAYLQAYSVPVLLRKNPTISFSIKIAQTAECRGYLIIVRNRSDNSDKDSEFIATSNEMVNHWNKTFKTILKKITVEDLGDMDAIELWNSIPEGDDTDHGDGRGRRDLWNHEKKLQVRVVFDAESKHVLLVGTKPKLQKKCITIRNMLSHYHWRLSGKDVSMI